VPTKRKFDEQIAELDALREFPEEARVEPLRKALANRNNFVVAKAADLARESRLEQLTPDLLAAFDRFFDNPEKSDPQCWAKNALSRALAAFEYQEVDTFVRGMRHIQLEPVWGGRSDTAGTLRATCALALVQCRSLTEADLLAHLIDLFADTDKTVRVEVLRAVAQLGSPSATLLLRARAVLGKDEPEVLGACYIGILSIDGVRAIPWVSKFLATADDCAGEAALAIAGTHSIEGFECLKQRLLEAGDPWWRSVVLSAIALCRHEAALEFLLDQVRTESLQAEGAIEAILRSGPSTDTVRRLEEIVGNNPRLARIFNQHRP
jgi:HEAT repeat protein